MIEIVVDDFASLLALLIPVVALGWFGNRLLGVRMSWIRTLVSGLVGFVLGVALAALTFPDEDSVRTAALALRAVAFGVLATMGFSIALDFIARPGREGKDDLIGRLPRMPHPIRRIKQGAAPPLRFQEVLRIARREGLLHPRFASAAGLADPSFGPSLRATLEACGGMFVKLGQVASTRSDLLPAPVIEELTKLQAGVEPETAEAIRGVIESELGQPVEHVFATFEWEPMAAASIGQVHRATLVDGEPVVVKVQRPEIAQVVERDTQAMLTLAGFVQRRTRLGLRMDVVTLVREFTDAIEEELDFTREARSVDRVRENRAGDEGIVIPAVHLDLCTSRLLVEEEVSGRSVSDQAALDASPVPRAVIADRLLQCYLGQILTDGVFHADPHPGNILISDDGTLALLDFGSTGVLDAMSLQALTEMLLATVLNDPALLERAVLALAPPPPGTDTSGLQADLSRFLALHVRHGGGLDVNMLRAMIDVLRAHKLAVPHSLTLLSRALVTLDGTLRTIEPGFSLAQRATAFATPSAATLDSDQVNDQIREELLRALPSLRTLPGHAEAIAEQLRSGQTSVRVRRFADPDEASAIRAIVNRGVLTAVGIGGILASAVLLLASGVEASTEDATVLETVGYVGLFLGSVVTMRVVALAVREGDR